MKSTEQLIRTYNKTQLAVMLEKAQSIAASDRKALDEQVEYAGELIETHESQIAALTRQITDQDATDDQFEEYDRDAREIVRTIAAMQRQIDGFHNAQEKIGHSMIAQNQLNDRQAQEIADLIEDRDHWKSQHEEKAIGIGRLLRIHDEHIDKIIELEAETLAQAKTIAKLSRELATN